MFRALVGIFCLILFIAPAGAQVFKWIDENGVTHYGERAPQGKKASEVSDRMATPAPATQKAGEDLQQKDREFRQRRIQAEESAEKKQQETARRREQCNQQRDLLQRLRQSPRTYRLDEKGERVFMNDSERDATIARQEQLVAEQCRESLP